MIKALIRATKKYVDPKQYHPEQNLYQHIGLVTARATLVGDRSLICAAILHDLCKPTHGRDHAKAMATLIAQEDEIRYFIHSSGGNVSTVQSLIQHHMDKQVTKKNKTVPHMSSFFKIDDMVGRHDQEYHSDILHPDGELYKNKPIEYIGMSQVQRQFQSGEFCIIHNRTVFHYPLSKADWVLKTLI